ncbi:DUF4232 domain-containing protein [Saccharopolyspora spinosa]|uniref:Uncharacterized protein DUF4232 n=1 Tax=Saccharopolyspora spinosa TaxID=60894 RepID=A0A2N3XZX0_SACSN|nr:DUF4232 domain-containing protein [Saccharopolyspora spinosa]PKW16180.1 uncharacterized protein DUF4232 [Saccharopolyspora spinosa]
MLKRHRMTTAITGLLGGALLVSGCGTAAALQSSPAPGHDARNVGMASGGGGGDIGTSNCSEADFLATATPVKGDPGSFIVAYGNRSDKTCTINGGVPNLKGVDMSNSPIEDLPVEDVRLPDAPEEFTLQPGQSAYAGIGMVLADSGDPNAHVLTGFQSSLPDLSEAQPVNVLGDGNVKFAAKYLRVSSLVSTADELLP